MGQCRDLRSARSRCAGPEVTTSVAILLFAWYTLKTAPQTLAILVATIILAWVVEAIWRAISKRQLKVEPAPEGKEAA